MIPFIPQLYTPYQITFKQPMKLGCTRKSVTEVVVVFFISSRTLCYKKPTASERAGYPMTDSVWDNILAIGESFPTIQESITGSSPEGSLQVDSCIYNKESED
jgi:hypothetical protein